MTKSAVLFDLDGTLADTAPDLGDALNKLLEEKGRAPQAADEIRKHASFGARGLITSCFKELTLDEEQKLITRFQEFYAKQLYDKTKLFPGVVETLQALNQRNIAWGVVTNKNQCFAEPILKQLKLHEKAHCLVYGDTVAHKKPSPDPLLFAAKELKLQASDCLYIGDSERDVIAAQSANMAVLIVTYGYESYNAEDGIWNCDGVLEKLVGLLDWVS